MSEIPTQQHSVDPGAGEAMVDGVALSELIHDLRSPLTVISGYAHLARRPSATEIPIADLMDPILRSVEQIEARLTELSEQVEAAEASRPAAS